MEHHNITPGPGIHTLDDRVVPFPARTITVTAYCLNAIREQLQDLAQQCEAEGDTVRARHLHAATELLMALIAEYTAIGIAYGVGAEKPLIPPGPDFSTFLLESPIKDGLPVPPGIVCGLLSLAHHGLTDCIRAAGCEPVASLIEWGVLATARDHLAERMRQFGLVAPLGDWERLKAGLEHRRDQQQNRDIAAQEQWALDVDPDDETERTQERRMPDGHDA